MGESMRNIDVMLEPVRGLLYQIGAFVPRLLLALAVLLLGWLIAKAASFAVDRGLRAANFHILSEKSGLDPFLREGGGKVDTVRILATLAYWLIILVALMIAFNSLNLEYVTELIGRLLLFVPRVIISVLLLALGAYFARIVGVATTTYFRQAGTGDSALLGRLATYAVLVFVVLIALEHLGLGDVVRQTFLILVGAVALGLALAFGLGGRHLAAEWLERRARSRENDADREQRPPPL
jgi:Mechanosensitive ion channel, conserved TM helix